MKLQLENNEYYLMKDGEELAIATTDESFIKELDAERLSVKNCQAIFNGYDLNELVYEEFQQFDQEARIVYRRQLQESLATMFNKALEILGDKKFSKGDMAYIINIMQINDVSFDEAIAKFQSLQQTEWDVEIVMECPQCKEYGYISECRNVCNKKFTQPKLDADGCLILRRKS